MKDTITEAEYLQLQGLIYLTERTKEKIEQEYIPAIASLIGEESDKFGSYNFVDDLVYGFAGSMNIDKFLHDLEIVVKYNDR